MGAAQTKNTADITLEALAKSATNIFNESDNSIAQSQLFDFSKNTGDIKITGNKFTQNATINSDNLLRALSTTTQQQQLAQSLTQSAESLVSGINLGQYSSAENITNAFMSATMDITTNIGQKCKNSISQSQTFDFNNNQGKIELAENSIEQVAQIFAQCIADVTANNEQIQKLDQEISQKASAKTIGINPFAIGAIIIGVLLILMLPAIKFMNIIMNFIMPILAIVGIVLIVVYFNQKTTEMSSTQYSVGLRNDIDCKASEPFTPENSYDNYFSAAEACKNDSSCQGLDWFPPISGITGATGISGTTTFYKKVGDPKPPLCNPSRTEVETNTSSVTLILRPQLFTGNSAPSNILPTQQENDMFLNTATGDMYQSVKVYNYSQSPATTTLEWKKQNGTLTPVYNIYTKYPQLSRNKPLTIINANQESITNKIFKDNSGKLIQGYIIVYNDLYTGFKVFEQSGDDANPVSKQVFSADASGNQLTLSATPVPNSPPPTKTSWSGTKITIDNPYLLYSGIALLVVGVLGTIFSLVLYFTRRKNNRVAPTQIVIGDEKNKQANSKPKA